MPKKQSPATLLVIVLVVVVMTALLSLQFVSAPTTTITASLTPAISCPSGYFPEWHPDSNTWSCLPMIPLSNSSTTSITSSTGYDSSECTLTNTVTLSSGQPYPPLAAPLPGSCYAFVTVPVNPILEAWNAFWNWFRCLFGYCS